MSARSGADSPAARPSSGTSARTTCTVAEAGDAYRTVDDETKKLLRLVAPELAAALERLAGVAEEASREKPMPCVIGDCGRHPERAAPAIARNTRNGHPVCGHHLYPRATGWPLRILKRGEEPL